jgi:vacuolar-type H+-ATPase subunit F/Vma7
MRLSVIGTSEDVIGFSLAGWPGVVCSTGEAVAEALRAECGDRSVALVLVSGSVARLAPDEIRRWQAAPGSPVVIVMPGGERREGAGQAHAEAAP